MIEASLYDRALRRPDCFPEAEWPEAGQWCVYLLLCEDGSLYAGTSNDFRRRFAQHCSGKGARYTRARKPVSVCWVYAVPDRSTALRAEHSVRQRTPIAKRELTMAEFEALVSALAGRILT